LTIFFENLSEIKGSLNFGKSIFYTQDFSSLLIQYQLPSSILLVIGDILYVQEDGMLEAGWARINSLLGRGKEPLVDRQPTLHYTVIKGTVSGDFLSTFWA